MKQIWQKLMRLFDKKQKHQMAGLGAHGNRSGT